ncbi:MAG TPA: HAD family hydrolase [Ktedonobacteraceae bacterium]|jgi:putative hydrolase of the HAD superfamily|nr:HAD family hydrolase [Ktedonobacteraceae bacterium]
MIQQHLLIDADDTLWENNIYFEQAIHEFIELLNHSTLTPAEVRVVINEVERTMGYGTASFTQSLVETYHRLAEHDVSDADILHIRKLGEQIVEQPLVLLDGVQETLTYLLSRHHRILLTKGDEEEQLLKVDRSGLKDYFEHILVVPEKDVETYQRVVNELALEPTQTWMIGNAPRSDINPALAAGLNAVFVPHPHTWSVEHQDIDRAGTGKLLEIKRFAELREYF